MLIEHRTYTLHPGAEAAFWDVQELRGPQGLRPIFERLIGFFASRSGPADQIVSVYRHDGFDDWEARLMGLYVRSELQPYFRAVRPLIARQESRFMRPVPWPELTPYWGHGRDWLPAHGPLLRRAVRGSLVEETRLTFGAGGVAACGQALREHGLLSDAVFLEGLLGCFHTVAGPLNQVMLIREFESCAAREAHRESLCTRTAWPHFLRSLAPFSATSEVRLLQPSLVADMSPMYVSS